MKKNLLLGIIYLVVSFSFLPKAMADTYYMYVDGQNYTDGQTANVSCTKSSILCRLYIDPTYIYYNDINTTWDHSSNYSISDSDIQAIVTLNLDANSSGGYVTLHAGIGGGTVNITVYINQKPQVPSFSSTPNLCTQGQSANYIVNFPASGVNAPTGIYWQSTIGITLNGSNSGGFIDVNPQNGTSQVNVGYSSYGTISVSSIAYCGTRVNSQSDPVIRSIGLPSSNDLSITPSGSICQGRNQNYTVNTAPPLSDYSYNWSVPYGSNNVTINSYGPNANISALNANTGFVLQLTINDNRCNNNVTTSQTIFINNCNGGYRVASNPARDNLAISFETVEDASYLPTDIYLVDEKSKRVKEDKVREKFSSQSKSVDVNWDIHSLVKGTYYLLVPRDNGKSESTRILIE